MVRDVGPEKGSQIGGEGVRSTGAQVSQLRAQCEWEAHSGTMHQWSAAPASDTIALERNDGTATLRAHWPH